MDHWWEWGAPTGCSEPPCIEPHKFRCWGHATRWWPCVFSTGAPANSRMICRKNALVAEKNDSFW